MKLVASVFENLEEVLAQENFAAAERKNEYPDIRHLVEQLLDLRSVHLAMIFVVEIAVHTALVAAIGQIQLNAQRDIARERFIGHLLEQIAHRFPPVST